MTPDEILSRIRAVCEAAFGSQLVGIYVHGSLAFGCYREENSDIDFLIVVSKALSLVQKELLIHTMLVLEKQGPEKGLEMSVVLACNCKPFIYPTPFEIHYSKTHREWAERDLTDYCRNMNGTDPDLAAHITVIHAAGKVLCGQPVEEVFGAVPSENYLDSLRNDVENAVEDIRRDPIYIILNLCRIAAWMETGKVLSKLDGGVWGKEHLPECYRPLISSAVAAYAAQGPVQEDEEWQSRFAAYMLQRIFPKHSQKIDIQTLQ